MRGKSFFPQSLVIATRKSPLAMWQANFVGTRLQALRPDLRIKLLPLTTQGDINLHSSLARIGGKGLFLRELELALERGQADFAVHSMKDIPQPLPAGFVLACVPKREDPRDVFVCNKVSELSKLRQGSVVGTASYRRSSQLLSKFSHLKVTPARGNLESRLMKLDDGQFDALILAASGLLRLGLKNRISSFLDTEKFLPAAGQGALGIECLARRDDLTKMLKALEDSSARWCIDAERAMTLSLGADCNFPVAAFARIRGGHCVLRGFVGDPQGKITIEHSGKALTSESPEMLGAKVARGLIEKGALEILKAS